MARKEMSKCVAVIIGGAIGGSIAGGGVGAAIEAIPGVTNTISTLLAFAIPSVLGLAGAIGAGGFAWGSTTACDKQPPDNGGSGPQSDRSWNQGMIIVRERVIVVWVGMFIAVLLPQVTRFAFSSVFSKQSLLVVQVVLAAIACCIWIIGTYWLYNQGVTARRRRKELFQLALLPEQIAKETQPEISVSDEASLKIRVYELCEDFLALWMKEQTAAFRASWEKLKTLPLKTLGQLGQTPATAQGLGFAGGSQQLLPIISVISWAVVNWPMLTKTNTSDRLQERIVDEAQARGFSLALSYALARYLQENLPVS